MFTGAIFSAVDPVYRGVDIPLRYFKAAAFIHERELAAIGYVVDQSPQLAELSDVPRRRVTEDVPPLGPFRTFQAPIPDVAELTGLDLDKLIESDRMPIAATIGAAPVGSTWRELGDVQDLTWTSTWRTKAQGRPVCVSFPGWHVKRPFQQVRICAYSGK